MNHTHLDHHAAGDYRGLAGWYVRWLLGRSWVACAIWTIIAIHALLAMAYLVNLRSGWGCLPLAVLIISARAAIRRGREAIAASSELETRH